MGPTNSSCSPHPGIAECVGNRLHRIIFDCERLAARLLSLHNACADDVILCIKWEMKSFILSGELLVVESVPFSHVVLNWPCLSNNAATKKSGAVPDCSLPTWVGILKVRSLTRSLSYDTLKA